MGKIKIDKERCKGCELCVISCPNGLITLTGPVNNMGIKTAKFLPAGRQVKGSKECKGCTFCAIMCPDCAIEVFK